MTEGFIYTWHIESPDYSFLSVNKRHVFYWGVRESAIKFPTKERADKVIVILRSLNPDLFKVEQLSYKVFSSEHVRDPKRSLVPSNNTTTN